MARRKEHYPFLLPSNALSVELSLDSTHKLSDFAYFDRHLVINTLKMSGYDTSAIDIPYNPSPIPGSWVFVIVFLVARDIILQETEPFLTFFLQGKILYFCTCDYPR